MCFGNAQTSQANTNSTQTTTPSPWLTSAASNNVNFAQNLQSTGFTPYTGNQVADFNPQQAASFSEANNIVGAVTPNLQLAGGALSNVLTGAGNQPTVNAESINSQMSPYMNQYVNLALQPQLQQAANAYMLQSQAQQGNATSAGAFGDAREGLAQGNLGLNYALENQGLVGNAYNAAFNTAIGAGAQDVSNNLNAQTTNAGLYNTGLNELLAGSNAGFSQGTGAANLQNTFGAQQTAQSQAGLNAQYNQWLMAQQYPFQTSQLLNSDLSAAQGVSPTTTTGNSTTTNTAPNNSGWGMLGSVLGTGASLLAAPFTGGMSLAALPAMASMGMGGLGAGGKTAADGGVIPSDEPTLIGERGPEMFVPHQSGTVIPYETLKAALDKKQGVSTTDVAHNRRLLDAASANTLAKQLGVHAMADGGMFADPSSMMTAPAAAAPVNAGAGFGGGAAAAPVPMPAPGNSFAAPPPVATAPQSSVIAPQPAPPPPVSNMQPAMPMMQPAQAVQSVAAPPPPQAVQSAAVPPPSMMQPAARPQIDPAMMQRFQQFMQQRQAQQGGGTPQNGAGFAPRPQITPQQIQQWQAARAAQGGAGGVNPMAGRTGSFGGGPVPTALQNNQQATTQMTPQQRWQQMLQSGGMSQAA